MAIVFPANGQTTLYSYLTQASGTSVTLTKPSGLADGDYLLFLGSTYGYGTWSSPVCSGWTNIASKVSTGGDTYSVVAAYKYVASAAGEPASYAFTFSNNNYNSGILLVVKGADSADFLAGTATTVDITDDATPTNAAMTTDAANAEVVVVLGSAVWDCNFDAGSGGAWTVTPPSGYTAERDATPSSPPTAAEAVPYGCAHWGSACTIVWAHKLVATAGTETPGAWAGFTGTPDWGALTFAIKVAAGGPTPKTDHNLLHVGQ